jgi:hypothetical protein
MPQGKPHRQSFWSWLRVFFRPDRPQLEPNRDREARNSFFGFVLGLIDRPAAERREMSTPAGTKDGSSPR